MRKLAWGMLVWPGLPQLWRSGAWSALGVALGWGALVGGLLFCSLVWSEAVSPSLIRLGWGLAGVTWLIGAAISSRSPQVAMDELPQADANDLFPQAQTEYLMGSWVEAEMILTRQIRHSPRDAESRLLLATLLRRTGRTTEAREQIERLQRLDNAARWRAEIANESQFLQNERNETQGSPASEGANAAQAKTARAA